MSFVVVRDPQQQNVPVVRFGVTLFPLFDCRAPVAVGTAAVSSAEMHSSGMKGRGVCVLHTYMDSLW